MDTANKVMFDDIPINKFHVKMAAITFGAHFQDGFSIGVIGLALTAITPVLQLSTLWVSLIASSALIGLFFGSFFLGWIANKVGRAKIFMIDFVIVCICTFLQFFVQSASMLFILRLLIGIGLGGDYSVGHTMLAEFLPRKNRGVILGSFSLIWTCGYVLATFCGVWLAPLGQNWRWLLVTAFPMALLVLIFRIGTPESPRWLIKAGRIEEANAIVHKYFGENVSLEDEIEGLKQGEKAHGKFSDLFGPKLIKRTAFNGLFTAALVAPYFAIYTFLPRILEIMGFGENFTTDLVINVFLIIGAILGLWMTAKFSRRGFLIGSFLFLAVTLFILGIIPSYLKLLLIIDFAAFTLIMSAISNIFGVYPAESFPTEIRSLGVGFATACSRAGAAVGTFLLPFSVSGLGIPWTMTWMAFVLLIGAIVTIAWAPETKNATLRDASSGDVIKSAF